MPYSFHEILPPDIQGEQPKKYNALLLSDREWCKLQYDLRWNEHEAAAVEMNLARRRAIKSKSDSLKKNWRDNVHNIRQHQLDARVARFASYDADRAGRYIENQMLKAEDRRKFLEDMNKLKFYEQDSVKTLNAALVFSEVLRERELQLEFEKKLRDIEAKREAVYAAKVKKDVEDYHEEERKKKEEKEIKMSEYRLETLREKKEREEQTMAEKKKNDESEREDMENLRKEMEKGEKLAREAMEALRVGVKQNVIDALEFDRAQKAAKKVEDDEEDRVIGMYAEEKQKIAKMCKLRAKEFQDEIVRMREKMKEKLGMKAKVKQDNEDELIRRALAKKEAEEDRVRLEKEEKKKSLRKERQDSYQEYLEDDARRKEEEKQVKKWEMLQRFRRAEENEAHAKRMQQKHEDDVIATREDYDRQVVQRDAMMESTRESDLHALEQAFWKAEDDKYFKYADEILEDSKAVGRPVMPIEKALHIYKAENDLLPRKSEHKASIHSKDKSHMTRKRRNAITPLDNVCTCGPILCTCNFPQVTCLCPS